jgi:VanZ family protein
MSDSRKKTCLAVLFVVLVILIMAGSLMPVAEMPGPEKTFQEKVMTVLWNLTHVPMYGVLTLVSLHYFECIGFSRRINAGVTAMVVMALGILIEVLQVYVPGRYGGVFDIGLNAVGMAGGMGVFFKIFRKSGG